MLQTDRIIVFAPHADDEALGCGGLLSKLRAQKGDELLIRLVLVSESDVTLHQGRGQDFDVSAETRVAEFRAVAAQLQAGVSRFEMHTRHVGDNPDLLIREVERVIRCFEADCVLFPYKSTHQDHRAVYDAVFAALRPRNCPTVRTALAYEVPNYAWSPEDDRFVPNVFVRLSDTELQAKIDLCRCYKSVGFDQPSGVKEIMGMVRRRGLELSPLPATDEHAVPAAEAYRLIRGVV